MANVARIKPNVIIPDIPESPSFVSRFLRNPQAVIGFIVVVLMILMALGADFITTYDPVRAAPRDKFLPPDALHIFGTDQIGRDILTRMIYGARVSLLVSLSAVTLSAFIGTLLGALAGYFGGWTDIIISRLIDTFLAIPGLVLTIGLVSILGSGLDKMVLAIGISSWPLYARLVRSSYVSLKEMEYVQAAHSIGAKTPRIILRHILPNAIGPVLVVMTIGAAGAILTEAGLSYLGIGLEPKIPTWGRMLAEAKDYIRSAAYMTIFPGIGIMIFTLGFNLLGEGLRDLLDPKIRKS